MIEVKLTSSTTGLVELFTSRNDIPDLDYVRVRHLIDGQALCDLQTRVRLRILQSSPRV